MAEEKKKSEGEDKYEIITKGLQEILGKEHLRKLLGQRDMKVYWGTAVTGAPHVGYFVPMVKIADFLRAGCHVTVLFADLHGYLDNMKSSWELLAQRTIYYENIIKSMLRAIGVPLDKLKFVRGSSYQFSCEFTLDVYKMSATVTGERAKHAGAQVVKQVEHPKLSGLLYPCLQALDEEYLGVDAQFGGVDQRKIFAFAREFLPQMGYKKRIHLMNPMVPGLQGLKMSSSEANTKINLLDSPKEVLKKINSAFCESGNVKNNGLLSFMKMVLFPINALKNDTFTLHRSEESGGDITVTQFEELEKLFAEKALHPGELKAELVVRLNALLKPIREAFASKEMQEVIAKAYPSSVKAPVKRAPGEPSCLDLRVGRIVACAPHAASERLLILSVDVGEAAPRQIVSAFGAQFKCEDLVEAPVVVMCNLAQVKVRNSESTGLVLVVSSGKDLEVVTPPLECKVGERVTFPGFEPDAPFEVLNPKKKVFEKVAKKFGVDAEGRLVHKGTAWVTSAGPCRVKTLRKGRIM